jgi:hypothetical protein
MPNHLAPKSRNNMAEQLKKSIIDAYLRADAGNPLMQTQTQPAGNEDFYSPLSVRVHQEGMGAGGNVDLALGRYQAGVGGAANEWGRKLREFYAGMDTPAGNVSLNYATDPSEEMRRAQSLNKQLRGEPMWMAKLQRRF